ncbi:MAG: nitroreductase family protein [Thalassolituus sp.]
MSLEHLLQRRYSVRAFSDRPVASEQLKTLFTAAQQAPSNCNTQPWQPYVIQGDALKRLGKALVAEVMKQNPPNPDFDWKISYSGEHRERQFGSANALYGAMGIARDDRPARAQARLIWASTRRHCRY